jgi:hypothetical protein
LKGSAWAWRVGLAIVVVTTAGLVTGAEWLLIDLLGTGLPLGTLATAISMMVLPALALPWCRSGWTRIPAWLLVVAGAAWLPFSAILAGNLRLQFTDGPDAWWTVTQLQPTLALLLVLGVLVSAGLRRWRNRDRRTG